MKKTIGQRIDKIGNINKKDYNYESFESALKEAILYLKRNINKEDKAD